MNDYQYRQMYKNNAQTISRAVEKMKNNQLTIEDILDEEDLVNDLKSPSFSQIISFLTTEKMEHLMDYMLKEPSKDCEHKIGHKFPYFSCEILCSENVFLLEKYFEDCNKQDDNKDEEENDHHHKVDEDSHQKPSLKEKFFDDKKDDPSQGEKHDDEEIQEDIKPEKSGENSGEGHNTEVAETTDESKNKTTENVENTKKDDDKDICEVLDGENSGRKRTVSISLNEVNYYLNFKEKDKICINRLFL